MERIKLNLIPSGVAPIVHLSQYDDGRKFGIDLFEGESVYVLDGTETLTVNSRKPDGHVVVIVVTNTGTSSLDVDTVEQLTAVHGVSYAKLQIVKGSVTIATLPFLIDVSRDPTENGDPSESFIQNLRTQIANGVAEEVATQYDSANVIFDNAPTSGHGTPYTVTSEGIKTAIDNAFDYDNTVSGSIVHIEDGADNIPVKSLVSQIVAVESGNGQPKSPTNPYTISGFANGIITRCGKNLWSNEKAVADSNTSSVYIENEWLNFTTGQNRLLYNFAYSGRVTFSAIVKNKAENANTVTIQALYNDGTNSIVASILLNDQNEHMISGITASGKILLGFRTGWIDTMPACMKNIQLELGDTATTYEAYNGNNYTFTFGQTVYGGHFDNKGNLVVTHGYIASYNGETINEPWVSSMDNYVPNTSPNTGAQVVYPLTNPITLAITSQDIPTLLGENNILSNCGDVTVEYYTEKATDVLNLINSEIGKKNGTNILIEANSPDSIKTYVDNGLNGKADTTDTYTKNEVDTLLADKADKTTLATKSKQSGSAISISGNTIDTQTIAVSDATYGIITSFAVTTSTNVCVISCYFNNINEIVLRVRNVSSSNDTYNYTIWYI